MTQTRTLIHIVGGDSWGGPERYALDICRHFKSEGWKVRVVTRDCKDVDSRFEEAGISLRHAALRRYPDIFSAMILRSMFAKIKPGEGIVHVHNFYDAFTALLARRIARRPDIRIVATRHEWTRGVDSWWRRKVYAGIDHLLFVSDFSRERFLAGWPDCNVPVDENKTGVAYNSLLIDTENVAPEPEKGPVVAMFRGRLRPGKGLETLIDALSLLKNLKLRLRIVGTGDPDYIDAIRRRAIHRGVMEKIDWTRRNVDAVPLIRESHFGVFPSVEPEAFGMSNLEFMACGRPQISTLTGGQREFLIPGEDSLESLPADATSLAEAMRCLATDRELRARMGERALQTFRTRLSWPQFISRLLPAYGVSSNA